MLIYLSIICRQKIKHTAYIMKNKATLIFLALALLFFVSCNKDDTRLPNMITDFASVVKVASSLAIQLDNGNVLTPIETPIQAIEDGSRVIVNYTPLQNNAIKINGIQEIYLANIQETTQCFEQLKKDPVKFISAWISGSYLNLSFQAEFHSAPHIQSLYIDKTTSQPTLYFSYSRETDPPGAYTQTYASYKLEGLEKENNYFILYIKTDKGNREIEVKAREN